MDAKCYLRRDLDQHGVASNLQFNEHIQLLQSQGKKIYHLGFGQSPFPVPSFAQTSLKKYAHVAQYLPVRGLSKLRKVICEMHKQEDDLHHFSPSDAIVGPGSKELIFLLLTVTSGDLLLLAPTWTTYRPQGLLTQHNVIKIPTTLENNWKLTPDLLDKVCDEHHVKDNSILIFCNPDNPTGTAYTRSELEELSHKFRKRNILVVSDEIYSRLSYDDSHVSLAKFYPEGTVISCGISKWASCGGWRLGYHLYPPQLRAISKAVTSAASQSYTSASAPVQYASISLLEFGDDSKEYAAHCRRILKAVALFCVKTLSAVGVKISPPAAGYYMFPDFEVIREDLARRGIHTGGEMCSAILEEANVALMAGGPAYLHSEKDLTVRLCFINFDGMHALKESESVGLGNPLPGHFVEECCSPTVVAINRIVAWMAKQKEV